jgi:pimeloyl-ACP methyl ester carboxylesterase
MTRFVLVPGAGGAGWFWHRVVPLLEAIGHRAIAVDLPADDPAAGLPAYTERVLAALDGDPHAVLVAQSLGGFTAAMVAARAPLAALIFVNAMIPRPGEIVGDWGEAVGSSEARTAAAKRDGYSTEFDDETYFLHDVPREVLAGHEERGEADIIWSERCDFAAWPAISIRAIAAAEDRLFPVDFQRRVARERLGVDIEVVPGGHLAALSRPAELVEALLRTVTPAC